MRENQLQNDYRVIWDAQFGPTCLHMRPHGAAYIYEGEQVQAGILPFALVLDMENDCYICAECLRDAMSIKWSWNDTKTFDR